MRRQLIVGGLAALALAAGGCGGDDNNDSPTADERKPTVAATPAPPDGAGKAFEATPVTAGANQGGGGGTLVARNGFDAAKDGFAFRNYGKNRGPMMRAQEIRELFGDAVCVDASAGECVLTPVAERWRQASNRSWEGGHCYGFSSLSLDIWRGRTQASQYGAQTTHALRIADGAGNVTNPELAADLSRSAAKQQLASVLRKSRKFTPTKLIETLKQRWEAGDRNQILAFFMPGVGGHAVVPVAIWDMGGGKMEIELYDNNFPFVPGNPGYSNRRFKVDTNTDRWDYTISVNPGVAETDWFGQGRSNMPELLRAEDQELPQPCPFCDDAPQSVPTTVTLTGDELEHGHLRITDADGNVTGYDNGELVNDIPGAEVVQPKVIQREFVAPEPMYQLPSGREYEIEVVDVPEGAEPHEINVTGPGVGVGLTEVSEEGTTLVLGSDGTVGLEDAAADAPELDVAVDGDREVTLVPGSDEVTLSGSGDGLRISGEVEAAKAFDPASGKTSEISGAGRVDLGDLVGSG
jgi:hypothetical protein